MGHITIKCRFWVSRNISFLPDGGYAAFLHNSLQQTPNHGYRIIVNMFYKKRLKLKKKNR